MKKAALVFMLIISVSLVCAIDYPHAFRGSVDYNSGGSVENGYIVTGEIEGVVSGSCVVEGGSYDLIVKGGKEGDEIKFYVNGVEADQGAEFAVFEITDLDLTVDAVPETFVGCGDEVCGEGEGCSTCSFDCDVCPCGNGICASDESCSTCSADCGSCDNQGGSSSSSSSGGGSSSSSSGGSGLKDIEPNDENLLLTQENSNDKKFLSVNDLNQIDEKRAKKYAGITGAVTGFIGENTGVTLVVVGTLTAVAGMAVVFLRKP